MAAPVPLAGRVLSAAGEPVSGALVWVASGTAPTPEIALRTRADGGFVVALPVGRFTLKADDLSGRSGAVTVSVGDGAATITITLGP